MKECITMGAECIAFGRYRHEQKMVEKKRKTF